MLHPRLRDPDAVAALADAFAASGSLRIDSVLDERAAATLADALAAQPFALKSPRGDLRFLYYEHAFVPETGCDHPTCAAGRWLWSEAAALAGRLAGAALGPPVDRMVTATLYSRGCYLDAHNDTDGSRALAFVLGLTRDTWPAERGGHLEFLHGLAVRERRAPGWNTLDLFDVRAPRHTHRVPMLLDPVLRLAVSGWFYPATAAAR
ncbi:MAG TPA: 2OG-Fe(II) oxygenase family protein [Kofleriaceae bacterium]|nr:2OG-Fe(II) oxygenase family protein [Kofleriaceae bacterium]